MGPRVNDTRRGERKPEPVQKRSTLLSVKRFGILWDRIIGTSKNEAEQEDLRTSDV